MAAVGIHTLTNVTLSLYSRAKLRVIDFALRRWDPFRDLPQEVLREILTYAIFMSTPTEEELLVSPLIGANVGSPFPLSQVCQRWRNIINSYSTFWTDVYVYRPSRTHAHRLELWMERSKHRTLRIAVEESSEVSVSELRATDLIIAILAKHRRRWGSVSFDLCEPTRSLTKAFLHTDTLGRLFDVNLSFEYDEEMPEKMLNRISSLHSRLTHIQRLESLKWRAPVISPLEFSPRLQYVELSGPIDVRELAEFMRNCYNLVSLSARSLFLHEDMLDAPVARINLPNLRSLILTLHPQDPSPLPVIFDYFAASSLTSLQLQNVRPTNVQDAEAPSDRNSICKFLDASNCTLTILNLHVLDEPADEFKAWITMPWLHSLTSLCLAGGIVDNALLEALTWRFRQDCHSGERVRNLFPKLRDLGLSTCAGDVDEGILLRMVSSRMWTPADPLQLAVEKTDVRTLHLWVRECTDKMVAYEEMITRCAERGNAAEEKRELVFRWV